MDKLVYLGLSILKLSKMLMYKFWYDYIKPKYGDNVNCHVDTNSFIIYIKTDAVYKNITEDVETWFNTSKYELDRLLSKEKKHLG